VSAVVADTHALVWLLTAPERLSAAADAAFERAVSEGIYFSAISLVELVYLVDKERLPRAVLDRVHGELQAVESPLRCAPLDCRVVTAVESIPRASVPDMPDRIIAATALALGLPLVTRDGRIRASSLRTIW
jgi:PIN domain nuclease of toxin-antitoxin system